MYQIPVSLWFINKRKNNRERLYLLMLERLGTMVSRGFVSWRMKTSIKISKIRSFVDGTLENIKGFCAIYGYSWKWNKDYILTPGRYVGIEQNDDEPFEEKWIRLTSELAEMFVMNWRTKSRKREKKLGAIGYELKQWNNVLFDFWYRYAVSSIWKEGKIHNFLASMQHLNM